MKLVNIKSLEDFKISENLKYHITEGLSLSDCIFRYGSGSHLNLLDEVRSLSDSGMIELSESDKMITEKLETGKKAIYQGKEVTLDLPHRISDDTHKFEVYHNSGKKDDDGNIKAIKIKFGDANSTIKNDDPERAASFWARHKCDTKKDPTTPGFWSCWAPTLFTKQLGLTSSRHW